MGCYFCFSSFFLFENRSPWFRVWFVPVAKTGSTKLHAPLQPAHCKLYSTSLLLINQKPQAEIVCRNVRNFAYDSSLATVRCRARVRLISFGSTLVNAARFWERGSVRHPHYRNGREDIEPWMWPRHGTTLIYMYRCCGVCGGWMKRRRQPKRSFDWMVFFVRSFLAAFCAILREFGAGRRWAHGAS